MPGQYEVFASARLSRMGFLACAPFEGNRYPKSIEEFGSHSKMSTEGYDVSLNMTGLTASTYYGVFCTIMNEYRNFTTHPGSSHDTGTSIIFKALQHSTLLTEINTTRVVVRTTCCIEIDIQLAAVTVPTSKTSINVLLITLPAVIRESLTLIYSANFTADGTSTTILTTNPFLPTGAVVTKDVLSRTLKSSLPKALTPGNYKLAFQLRGPHAEDYEFIYNDPSFTALTVFVPPYPIMRRAYFTADAEKLVILFDSDTNRGNTGASFLCAVLFTFPGSATSLCQWSDERTVVIDSAKAPYVNVGDSIILKSGLVRAKCTEQPSSCATWPLSISKSVVVSAPVGAVIPKVIISSPTVLGACNDFVLILTSSTGSGGRAWKRATYEVYSPIDKNASSKAIANFFFKNYSIDAMTPVPSRLLVPNVKYFIRVTLCNFLNLCSGRTLHSLQIETQKAPIVSIFGSSYRYTKRYTPLTVDANAYTESCSGAIDRRNLTIHWEVCDSNQVLTTMKSISRIPSSLKLPAYSLSVGAIYIVKLKVRYDVSGIVSEATATIQVVQSNIVAVLLGGEKQSLRIGTTLTLDGSTSYDQDVNGLTGAAANLSYVWSCQMIEPLDPYSCGVNFSSTGTETVTIATDNPNNVNSMSGITMGVFDNNGRYDEVYVVIVVVPASAPVITILPSETRIIADKKLKLSSSIQFFVGGTATWSVDDTSVDMYAVTLTHPSKKFKAGVFHFGLVAMPMTLPTVAPLVFSLLSGDSICQITVFVVGPPSSGSVQINPTTGNAMNDEFKLSAARWKTTEYPLTYFFGYKSTSGADMTVQARSEGSLASARLPGGHESKGFVLEYFAEVFNGLDASHQEIASVVILPIDIMPSELLTYMTSTSQQGSIQSNNNFLKQAISLGAATLASRNCSAVDCKSLGRHECWTADNWCGSCLDGYMGNDDAGNEECIQISEENTLTMATVDVNHRRTTEACVIDSDCPSSYICFNRTCAKQEKSCPNGCSSKGFCSMILVSTHQPVDHCYLGDNSCRSACVCHNNSAHTGADCSLTPHELADLQKSRVIMTESIETVIATEDMSEDSVRSIIGMVIEVGSTSSELTAEACRGLMRIINATLTYYIDNHNSYTAFTKVPGVISNCMEVYSKLLIFDSDINTDMATASGIVDMYTQLVLSDLQSGEDEYHIVEDAFRKNIRIIPRQESSSVKIQSPVTYFESVSGKLSASVHFVRNNFSESDFTITFAEHSGYLYLNMSQFVTNVFELYISDPTTTDAFDFTLYTNIPQPFTTGEDDRVLVETQCHPQHEFVINYTCPGPSEMNVTHVCDGSDAHRLTSLCPAVAFLPTCGVMLPYSIEENTICKMVRWSSNSVDCSCVLGRDERRRLGSSSDRITLVALTETASVDVYDVWSTNIEPGEMIVSYAVTAFVCTLFASAVIAALLLLSTTSREPMVYADANDATDKGGSSSTTLQKHLMNYFRLIYPKIFTPEGYSWSAIFRELCSHHEYAKCCCARTPLDKICAGLHMFTTQLFMFVILLLLYNYQYPVDDGSCADFGSKIACLEEKAPFDYRYSKCEWKLKDDFYFCKFRDTNLTVVAVAVIGIVAAVISAVINRIIDPLFEIVMAGKTADPGSSKYRVKNGREIATGDNTEMLTVSTNYSPEKCFGWLMLDCSREPSQEVIESRNAVLYSIKYHPLPRVPPKCCVSGDVEIGKFSPDRKLSATSLVTQQRAILAPLDVPSFDNSWLIDEDSGQPLKFILNRGSTVAGNEFTAMEMLEDEVQCTQEVARQKVESLRNTSDNAIGMELCHNIVQDLLGRHSFQAKAFALKCESDFCCQYVVAGIAKKFAWVVIILLNLLLTIVLCILTSGRDETWQLMFLIVCSVQLLIDIFITRAGECAWTNLVVPHMIMSEVQSALRVVYDTVSGLTAANAEEENSIAYDNVLDVPALAFVSTALAEEFHALFESIVIRSYHSYIDHNVSLLIQHRIRDKYQTTGSYVVSTLKYCLLSFSWISISQWLTTLTRYNRRMFLHILLPVFLWIVILSVRLVMRDAIIGNVLLTLILLMMIYQVVTYWYLIESRKGRSIVDEIRPLAVKFKPHPVVPESNSARVMPASNDVDDHDMTTTVFNDLPKQPSARGFTDMVATNGNEDIESPLEGQISTFLCLIEDAGEEDDKESSVVQDLVDGDISTMQNDTVVGSLVQSVNESLPGRQGSTSLTSTKDSICVVQEFVEVASSDDQIHEVSEQDATPPINMYSIIQTDVENIQKDQCLDLIYPFEIVDSLEESSVECDAHPHQITEDTAGDILTRDSLVVECQMSRWNSLEEKQVPVDVDREDLQQEESLSVVSPIAGAQTDHEVTEETENTTVMQAEKVEKNLPLDTDDAHDTPAVVKVEKEKKNATEEKEDTSFVVRVEKEEKNLQGFDKKAPMPNSKSRNSQETEGNDASSEEIPGPHVRKIPRRPRPADVEDTAFRPLHLGMGLVFGTELAEEPGGEGCTYDDSLSAYSGSMWGSPLKSSIESTYTMRGRGLDSKAPDPSPVRPSTVGNVKSNLIVTEFDTSSVRTPGISSRRSKFRETMKAIKSPEKSVVSPAKRGDLTPIQNDKLILRHLEAVTVEKISQAKRLRVLTAAKQK